MRVNFSIACALWVVLSSVFWVLGCGGDAFEMAQATPGQDAAADVPPGDAQDGGVDADLQDAMDATADASQEAIELSPDPLDFGNQPVSTTSPEMVLKIRNAGGSTLPKPALTFVGTHPDDFAVASDNCPAAGLLPNESCEARLTFTPGESGVREATVVVVAGTHARVGTVRGTGVSPAQLVIDPTQVDFGTVVVPNASSPIILTVTNQGGASTDALVTTIDPASGPFTITSDTCAGANLAPGSHCFVAATFKPSAAGHATATLHVKVAGANVSASLEGTGVLAGNLAMSPSSLDLGSVPVGEIGQVQYFTLTNQGSSDTGTLAISLQGTNATDFAIASNPCPSALHGGDSCVIGVRLAPQTAGAKIATLVASADPGGTASASLSGKGLRPAVLSIVPNAQDFGTIASGSTSAPFQFTVRNDGETASGAVAVSLSGNQATEFRIDDQATTCHGALDPGSTCNAVVRFAPISDGTKQAVLHATAAPGGDVTSSLTGTGGTPSLLITPGTWDFGDVRVGAASQVKAFEIKNAGTVQSGVPNVSLAQQAPADFSVVANGCTAALDPQASCTVQLQFKPTVAGNEAATLQVNAIPGGSAVASLRGRGLAPAQLSLTPPSFDFGTLPLNTSSAPAVFTLTNTGDVATSNLTIWIEPPLHDFSITSNTCPMGGSLGGGVACSISVTFTPTATGQQVTSLRASATEGGTVSSSLSGAGTTQAALAITPSTYDYGNVIVNQSATTTFTVRNTGGAPSGILQMQLGDKTNFAITSDGCSNHALAGSGTCDVTVKFQPTTPGGKSTSLSAQANPGGTATASLTGNGLGPAVLELTPASFDFGLMHPGVSSALVSFTLKNKGGSASGPLHITIEGAVQSEYQIVSAGGTSCIPNSQLGAGASCTIGVVFSPTSYGVKAATLTAAADPGGTAASSLTGGTPDIFVSMTGSDTNDGRTPSTPVRHVGKGLSMASAGWTVHLAYSSTAYSDGESWPLIVGNGVTLFGDAGNQKPIIEPASSNGVATVLKLEGSGATAEQIEVRSGTGIVINDNRIVVLMSGSNTVLRSSAAVCQTPQCTAVRATGSGTSQAKLVVASLADSGTGLSAAATSNGVVWADQFTVNCPVVTNITKMNTIGIEASAGSLQLQGSGLKQCVHGLSVTGNAYVSMRSTKVINSYLYGVEVSLGIGTPSPPPDLGTETSPGNNVIQSSQTTARVGLAVQSSNITVNAAGNTWLPNVQGADGAGHYGHFLQQGPVLEPGPGESCNNYSIAVSSGIQF